MKELQLNISIDVHGVADGRKVASELLDCAFALLIPYAQGHPEYTTAIFSKLIDRVVQSYHDSLDERGKLQGEILLGIETDSSAKFLHFQDTRKSTKDILQDILKETTIS